MKAISLHQPWASLIAIGAKPFETRSWAPPRWLVGQRIAIHAAKKACPPDIELDPDFAGAFAGALPGWSKQLPFGVVVCTALLTAAYLCGEAELAGATRVVAQRGGARADLIQSDAFGDYALGRWAWHLAEIKRFEPPIPARGAQGFWNWNA